MPIKKSTKTNMALTKPEDFDVDKDGKVTDEDIARTDRINEIELREQKADTQKKMAWTSLIAMVVLTAALFIPSVSDSRVSALGTVLDLFYIAQAGIVGAYMGVTAWMARKNNESSDYNYRSYTPGGPGPQGRDY